MYLRSTLLSQLIFFDFRLSGEQNFSWSTEPLILMESTMPLTLDNILEYEEAVSGDCIVGVPEVSPRQDFSWGYSYRITFPPSLVSLCSNKSG